MNQTCQCTRCRWISQFHTQYPEWTPGLVIKRKRMDKCARVWGIKTCITYRHDFCLLSSYMPSIILTRYDLHDMTTLLITHTRCTVSVLDSATMQQIYALRVSRNWWKKHLTLLPESHYLISIPCTLNNYNNNIRYDLLIKHSFYVLCVKIAWRT